MNNKTKQGCISRIAKLMRMRSHFWHLNPFSHCYWEWQKSFDHEIELAGSEAMDIYFEAIEHNQQKKVI